MVQGDKGFDEEMDVSALLLANHPRKAIVGDGDRGVRASGVKGKEVAHHHCSLSPEEKVLDGGTGAHVGGKTPRDGSKGQSSKDGRHG